MNVATVRLHFLDAEGRVRDSGRSFRLDAFAGFLPAIGDQILEPQRDPGALPTPEGRRLLTVVGRVFNPRDLDDFVALICTAREAREIDADLLPDIDLD